MHAFTEARLHHVVVGWVVGFASMPLLGPWLERGVLLAALFLVGWYAMTFGALVDWRVMRLMNRQMLRVRGAACRFALSYGAGLVCNRAHCST